MWAQARCSLCDVPINKLFIGNDASSQRYFKTKYHVIFFLVRLCVDLWGLCAYWCLSEQFSAE